MIIQPPALLSAFFNCYSTNPDLLNSILKKGELALVKRDTSFDHLNWEYKVMSLEPTVFDTELEGQMNREGMMGWELVSTHRRDEAGRWGELRNEYR